MKEEAIKAPLAESGETMTVSELFESWLTSEKDNSSDEALRRHYLCYTAFLETPFGNRRVNDVSFKEWTDFTKSVPTTNKTLLGKVTADSFQNALKAFKRMFAYFPKFLDWSGVEHRPFTALKNTFVKQRFDSGTDIDVIRRQIGEVHIENTIARYFEIKQ